MKRPIFCILIFLFFSSCEKMYTPKLDVKEESLVVEGRFVSGWQINSLNLYKTLGFYDDTDFPVVPGARITLIDDNDNHFPLQEGTPGTYQLNYSLDSIRQYKISIELEGEFYESALQSIPESPVLDTLYLRNESRTYLPDWSNSVDDIVTEYGAQVYVDIENKSNLSYYWFSGKKISQNTGGGGIYTWETHPLDEFLINIAGPPEFSTVNKITARPLEFFNKPALHGWIYIIYQYGLSQKNYNYYKNLNKQLASEGKLFDPLYIQPQGNIKCVSNPENEALGNFEIISFKEYRYYLMFYQNHEGNMVDLYWKKIPYFYDIPAYGSVFRAMPEFWESPTKQYP